MTSYGQTVTGQQQPLTLTETKQLLRASLDREAVLVEQRNTALDHIKSLDKQIITATTAAAVDAKAIENLQAQKTQLLIEVTALREALADQREATASLRTALERAEQEVERQKGKVKAANRRTMWGIAGGVIVGILAAIALQKE